MTQGLTADGDEDLTLDFGFITPPKPGELPKTGSDAMVPLGIGGPVYLWTALVGGAVFIGVGVAGMRQAAGNRWARLLFTVSLLYLSLLMVGLLVGQALNGPEDAAALLGVLRLI